MVWPFATILRDKSFEYRVQNSPLERAFLSCYNSHKSQAIYIMAVWNPYRKSDLEAILTIPLSKRKKKKDGNAKCHVYSAHRWKKQASELVYWFFQYNNLRHREKDSMVVFLKMRTPAPSFSAVQDRFWC